MCARVVLESSSTGGCARARARVVLNSSSTGSIVIVALVLGGPECVRVVLSSSSSSTVLGGPESVRVCVSQQQQQPGSRDGN